MKKLLFLVVSAVLGGCIFPPTDYIETVSDSNRESHVVNQYEIINLCVDTAQVYLNWPENTDCKLGYGDTLRYFFQNVDDDGIDVFCPQPFEKATLVVFEVNGVKHTFSKGDKVSNNPLDFSNYEIIRNGALHYTFRYYINPTNF